MKRWIKAEICGCVLLGLMVLTGGAVLTRFIPDAADLIVPSKCPYSITVALLVATIVTALLTLRYERPQNTKKLKRGRIFF